LLLDFALGIDPALDDLDAIEIRADGILQRATRKVGALP
jgi:hypothetical protein